MAYGRRDAMAMALPGAEPGYRFPAAAFALPDGDFAVVEERGRIVRLSPAGELRWATKPGEFYGLFISVDAGEDGALYAIDRVDGGAGAARFERVVRIGADGSPAGVLVQKRFSGAGGFVPGSLAVKDGFAWYLFADDAGSLSLAKAGLRDARERVLVKADWKLPYASLAPAEGGERVIIAGPGGLIVYEGENFRLMTEYADDFPYPARVRFAGDGTLLVADAYRSMLFRAEPDGGSSPLLSPSLLAPLGDAPPLIADFSLRGGAILFVERSSGSIVQYQTDSSAMRSLPSPSLGQTTLAQARVGWFFAVAALAFTLLGLAWPWILALRRGPAPIAFAAGILPALLATLALGAWFGRADALSSAASAEEELRDALALAVSGLTRSIDPATAEGLRFPADAAKPAYRDLAGALAAASRGIGLEGLYASAYTVVAGRLRYIADQAGAVWPGQLQPYAPREYARLSAGSSAIAAAYADPYGDWIAAAIPIGNGESTYIVELSIARPRAPFVMTPRVEGLRWVWLAGLLFLAAIGAWAGLVWSKRGRARYAAALAAAAAAEHEGAEGAREEHAAAAPASAAPASDEPALNEPGREAIDSGPAPRKRRTRVSPAEAHRLAAAYIKRGRPEVAAEILEVLIGLRPRDAKAFNNLGIAYKRMGKLAKALACVERAAELDPTNGETKANLDLLRELVG
jgi:tetratricopeptide (TPR) repeat protein